MHETSIVQSLLEQVRSFLPDGATLRAVHVEVGRLEHLDADVMQTAWSVLTEGADLGGAKLMVTSIPLCVRCRGCGRDYEPEEPAFMLCPFCEKVQPEVVTGTGVLLRSIDVEKPEHATGKET